MNKKLIIASAITTLIIAGILLVMLIPTGTSVEEPEKVRIGYREHLYYLPAYVAQTQGYFAAEGLEAELVPYSSTNQLVEALLNGQIDAGIGGVNSIVLLTIEAKDPGHFLIFGQSIYTSDYDALLVRQDSSITELSEVKTIATLPGTSAKFWVENMLAEEGLTDEVKIIQINAEEQLAALESGSVDAVHVLEPLVTVATKRGIGRVLIQSPINTYYRPQGSQTITSVMNKEFARQNPETAQKIIKATDKAVAYIAAHPEEARSYYAAFTPIAPEYASALPVPVYETSSAMDIGTFQGLADSYAKDGLMAVRIDVQGMLGP